jgi:hypothetical protein
LTLSSTGQNASRVQHANAVLPRGDEPSLTFGIFPFNESRKERCCLTTKVSWFSSVCGVIRYRVDSRDSTLGSGWISSIWYQVHGYGAYRVSYSICEPFATCESCVATNFRVILSRLRTFCSPALSSLPTGLPFSGGKTAGA